MAKPAKTSKAELERGHRIQSWEQARREGIREGLFMAMHAVHHLSGDSLMLEAIKARGDRHFGDSDWQTQPRR